MVNTRTTADCGLDAAGVTERVHRSSGYRAALPRSRRTSYAVVVTVLPKWSRPYDLRVCSMFARMSRYGLAAAVIIRYSFLHVRDMSSLVRT